MRFLAGLAFALLLSLEMSAQTIHGRDGITLTAPPASEADPVADDYFGTKIPDNYRWLEDAKSTQTRAFIDAQNAYTTRYMKQAHVRTQLLDDLDALEHVSRWSVPIQRAGNLYFMKRLADVSRDGTLLAYHVRQGGADQSAIRVFSMKTSKPLEDELPAGIYYSVT